jgi:DNA recombination-dependent growth factor C
VFSIPENYLIASKEELVNSKKVVKKHIENQVKELENKSELNDIEKKKLKTLKERLTKM